LGACTGAMVQTRTCCARTSAEGASTRQAQGQGRRGQGWPPSTCRGWGRMEATKGARSAGACSAAGPAESAPRKMGGKQEAERLGEPTKWRDTKEVGPECRAAPGARLGAKSPELHRFLPRTGGSERGDAPAPDAASWLPTVCCPLNVGGRACWLAKPWQPGLCQNAASPIAAAVCAGCGSEGGERLVRQPPAASMPASRAALRALRRARRPFPLGLLP
jgi:hypothetical protein